MWYFEGSDLHVPAMLAQKVLAVWEKAVGYISAKIADLFAVLVKTPYVSNMLLKVTYLMHNGIEELCC